MDDPLKGRAYARMQERLRHFSLARSGLLTTSILVFALVVFGFLWQAHRRAQFHRLRTPIVLQDAPVSMPGGQEAITLSRMALLNGTAPEYVSTTVLPGLGMQVLQMTVDVPDRGTIPLLFAPSVGELAAMPHPLLDSGPFHLRLLAKHGSAEDAGTDLIGSRPATDVHNLTTPDGGEADGNFGISGSDAEEARVDATVSTNLSGHTLDLLVRVTNHGQQSRGFVLDWSPKFKAPGGKLSHFALAVPAKQSRSGLASGPVAPQDLSAVAGTPLRESALDTTYFGLKRDFLSEGPVLRLMDLDHGLMLRMTALSMSIRSVRVIADPKFATLTLSFSTADPGNTAADDEMQMLRPGQTQQWHLRLEVLAAGEENKGESPTASLP